MSTNLIGNIDNLLSVLANIATVLFSIFVVAQFVLWILNDGILLATIRLFSYRILVPFILVITLNLVSLAIVFVVPQEVGVVVSAISPGGVRPLPVRGGIHWIVPFVESVEHYPLSFQTYTMSGKVAEGNEVGDDSIRARTSDGQEVFIDVSLIFRINIDQSVLVHIDWQDRYIEDLIRPVARGLVRTQVSQFKVAEVNSSARKDLEITLDRLIREELDIKGFVLDQFLVRDITFSEEYAASIEQKQVALEEQAKAVFRAEEERRLAQGEADAARIRAQGEADATLIQAQADAASLDLIAESLGGKENLVTYRYVERLAPGIQVMLVPNDNPFLLPLPELQATDAVSPTISSNTTDGVVPANTP